MGSRYSLPEFRHGVWWCETVTAEFLGFLSKANPLWISIRGDFTVAQLWLVLPGSCDNIVPRFSGVYFRALLLFLISSRDGCVNEIKQNAITELVLSRRNFIVLPIPVESLPSSFSGLSHQQSFQLW